MNVCKSKLTGLLFLFLLLGTGLFAQKGTLRGSVVDDNNGEMIMFAAILIEETGGGTTTDIDGNFSLELDPGTYTLAISYLGYADLKVSDVVIEAGQVNVIEIRMKEDVETLEEVVVTAQQITNNEAAFVTLKRKSANLVDGISAQTFSRAGDGDAASAIKRVTGVSVEGGKHVFVRGLGDRYTKTLLNGMDIPGLDPDRNTVQMDIFPTNLIDNIAVYKNFSPDLPGDFTGGLVNIVTKDFPDRKTITASANLGYNTNSSFNDAFVAYEGGDTDFLGFDDGTRELPINRFVSIPDPARGQPLLTDLTRAFTQTMGTMEENQFLDFGLGASIGNQINKDKVTIGYNVVANYRRANQFYDDVEFNSFKKENDRSLFDLEKNERSQGKLGIKNVLWSGLAGVSLKWSSHKISLNAFRTQNGETKAAELALRNFELNPVDLSKDNLEYIERSITNFLLKGKHSFSDNRLVLEWAASPTFSRIDEPDIRFASFEIEEDGDIIFAPDVGAEVIRLWRNLQEDRYIGKIDLTYDIRKTNKLKVGVYNSYKERDYEILTYPFRVARENEFTWTGDPDQIFESQNIWTPETDRGTFVRGNFEPANTYSADQNIFAAYAMNEVNLTERLKAIYGVRFEKVLSHFTGQNNPGTLVAVDSVFLDENDFLPSANLVYNLFENKDEFKTVNIRASYYRTLARPSFKEKSFVQIQDLISRRTFVGNPDLQQTYIDNFDLRFEYYMKSGQIVSLSGFYKQFDDPIELVAFSDVTPNDFQPKNVDQATVFGIEFEVRKSLEFLSPSLSNFTLGTNVTVVEAETTMDGEEFQSRQTNARDGETIDDKRDMVGQSPYIINVFANFNSIETGWEASATYNVQGRRLSIAGITRNPDVYELPFNSLNLKVSKRFGTDQRWKASLTAENVLGDDRVWVYDSYRGREEIFQKWTPGTVISVGLGYSIQ